MTAQNSDDGGINGAQYYRRDWRVVGDSEMADGKTKRASK